MLYEEWASIGKLYFCVWCHIFKYPFLFVVVEETAHYRLILYHDSALNSSSWELNPDFKYESPYPMCHLNVCSPVIFIRTHQSLLPSKLNKQPKLRAQTKIFCFISFWVGLVGSVDPVTSSTQTSRMCQKWVCDIYSSQATTWSG